MGNRINEEDLMTDLGENYEYVNTIVRNTIELKKLEYSEQVAQGVGHVLTYIFVGILGIIFFTLALVLFILFLSQYLHSMTMAVGITMGLVALITLIIIVFRKNLFVNPILSAFYNKIS